VLGANRDFRVIVTINKMQTKPYCITTNKTISMIKQYFRNKMTPKQNKTNEKTINVYSYNEGNSIRNNQKNYYFSRNKISIEEKHKSHNVLENILSVSRKQYYGENESTSKSYKLKYREPSMNPFYTIFHEDYSPFDFAKDAIESLLAVGCEPSSLISMIETTFDEMLSISPAIRSKQNLLYPGDKNPKHGVKISPTSASCFNKSNQLLINQTFVKSMFEKEIDARFCNHMLANLEMKKAKKMSSKDLEQFISMNLRDLYHKLKEKSNSSAIQPRRLINKAKKQVTYRNRLIKLNKPENPSLSSTFKYLKHSK
jgi:hypothetical protein